MADSETPTARGEAGPGPFAEWIGRTTVASDTVTPQLAERFAATLLPDRPAPGPGEAAPDGIHWCLAPQVAPQTELGPDGHPSRGTFLPPVPLPNRMWAGGGLAFHDALRVGDTVERTSEITGIAEKTGRSGRLVFVTLRHTLATARGTAIVERQDIVYRDAVKAAARASEEAPPAPPSGRSRSLMADPVLLFRYSALTFNGHRIHYDQPYATGVEGYEGILVHGPLQATLLLHHAASIFGGTPAGFSFRGVRPLPAGRLEMDAENMEDGLALTVRNARGQPTTIATARPEAP